jgi:hypothetical protein
MAKVLDVRTICPTAEVSDEFPGLKDQGQHNGNPELLRTRVVSVGRL